MLEDKLLKITLLGTGTSHGVPVIACSCKVCNSTYTKDKRLRVSAKIEWKNQCIVIDAGPDFRQQMLQSNTQAVNALLLTHEHRDHIAGLDDIRSFNYQTGKPLTIYCQKRVRTEVEQSFAYIFNGKPYPGKPQIQFQEIEEDPFKIGNLLVQPFFVNHYQIDVTAYRIGNFAYLTDIKALPDKALDKLQNLDVLVLGCLRQTSHISHLQLSEAVALAENINAKETYFVHMSHDMGLHHEVNQELPPNIQLAYDGQIIYASL